jgi:hypothetical protein
VSLLFAALNSALPVTRKADAAIREEALDPIPVPQAAVIVISLIAASMLAQIAFVPHANAYPPR